MNFGNRPPVLACARVALLLLTLVFAAPARAAGQPNIVYILADDLGWHDLGYLGREIKTPNIDRIADGAVRLNQFYVQPFSSQTRAALLTGRYPFRYGFQTLSLLPESDYGLAPKERTLADALKAAGYHTALVGKWQLGHARKEFLPTHRGFDSFYGTLAGNVDHFTKDGPRGHDWYRDEHRSNDRGYDTTLIGREATRIIAHQDPSKPLFLFVSFTAPAAPLQAPKEYMDRNASIKDATRRTYAGMVSALDDAVGAILDELAKKKMSDNTIIVFHSDNGGAVPHRFPTGDGDVDKGAADNSPYRDGGGSLYEGGVRVPALFKWPAGVQGGITDQLMHVSDMYPTLIRLAGGSLDQRKPLDGVDQWETIHDGTLGPRKDIPLAIEDLRAGLRMGDWKLLVFAALPARVELYDIPHDPGEEDNVADRNPQVVQEMMKRISDYAWEMVPSLHLQSLTHAHSHDLPMVWRQNPIVFGAGVRAHSRGKASLTTEFADTPDEDKK